MSTMGNCCCDCCLSVEEMPYDSVTLIAPAEDCNGGLDGEGVGVGGGGAGIGDPEDPSASFVRFGCCEVARFNLNCQEWSTEHCSLYATQEFGVEFSYDDYKIKLSYADELDPETYECPCIHTQTTKVEDLRKYWLYFYERHKLKAIEIKVGKVATKCTGEETPICRFFIAADYIFDVEYCFNNSARNYQRLDVDCTGVYRDGSCSYTNSYIEEFGEDSDDCPEGPYFPCAFSLTREVRISRIKLYDTLPTGQVTITNADLPPVNCCGDEAGCVVTQNPCGLNLVSNCINLLPSYEGDIYFDNPCSDPETGEAVCPFVEAKTNISIGTVGYVRAPLIGTDCYTTTIVGPFGDWTCTDTYAGLDQLLCPGEDINGDPIPFYDSGLPGCYATTVTPPALNCVIVGCDELGGECGYVDPNTGGIVTAPCGDLGDPICRRDIEDFACNKPSSVTVGNGNVCFTLPTVTIEV